MCSGNFRAHNDFVTVLKNVLDFDREIRKRGSKLGKNLLRAFGTGGLARCWRYVDPTFAQDLIQKSRIVLVECLIPKRGSVHDNLLIFAICVRTENKS